MSNKLETLETKLRLLTFRKPLLRQAQTRIGQHHSLAQIVLYLSLPLIFLLLVFIRPPTSFYTLPIIPIALAAMLYELVGGTVAALTATVGVSVVIALDPLATRRAIILQEAWPILLMYQAERWEAKELIKRHIFALRQKIEPNPTRPRYILNVRGVGYRMATVS